MADIHLTPEELSLYLENQCSSAEVQRISSHLRSCEDCFAIYRDLARYLSLWETDPHAFRSKADLASLDEEAASWAKPGRQEGRRQWWDIFRGRMLLGTAALTAVILIAGALWIGRGIYQNEFRLNNQITAPVQIAIEMMSARSPIVLPGGEGALDHSPPVIRDNVSFIERNDSLAQSLEFLSRAYHEGESSSEVLYWLVSGLLASGQLDLARDYTRHALELYPENDAIVTLAALVMYELNDPAEAIHLLMRVANRSPGDPVALINLGVLLMVHGERDQALEILQPLHDKYAGQPLGNRAGALIESIRQ